MPSAPRYVDGPASDVSIVITPRPSETAYSCTPNVPYTSSPTANPGCAEAATRPTAPARMTAPISTGGTYEAPAFIQPRMAGSTDRCETATTNCPSAGSGTSSVVSDQSVARGSPEGRAARRTWRLVSGMRRLLRLRRDLLIGR